MVKYCYYCLCGLFVFEYSVCLFVNFWDVFLIDEVCNGCIIWRVWGMLFYSRCICSVFFFYGFLCGWKVLIVFCSNCCIGCI